MSYSDEKQYIESFSINMIGYLWMNTEDEVKVEYRREKMDNFVQNRKKRKNSIILIGNKATIIPFKIDLFLFFSF